MRQPTPVRSAIRSILFIVPRNRFFVPSNWSFIFSANAVESRISSPIAIVSYYEISMPICNQISNSCQPGRTYILQHPHFLRHLAGFVIVLTFKLLHHRIAILALLVGRSWPKAAIAASSPSRISVGAWICAEASSRGRLRTQVICAIAECIWRGVVGMKGRVRRISRARPRAWGGCCGRRS